MASHSSTPRSKNSKAHSQAVTLGGSYASQSTTALAMTKARAHFHSGRHGAAAMTLQSVNGGSIRGAPRKKLLLRSPMIGMPLSLTWESGELVLGRAGTCMGTRMGSKRCSSLDRYFGQVAMMVPFGCGDVLILSVSRW